MQLTAESAPVLLEDPEEEEEEVPHAPRDENALIAEAYDQLFKNFPTLAEGGGGCQNAKKSGLKGCQNAKKSG